MAFTPDPLDPPKVKNPAINTTWGAKPSVLSSGSVSSPLPHSQVTNKYGETIGTPAPVISPAAPAAMKSAVTTPKTVSLGPMTPAEKPKLPEEKPTTAVSLGSMEKEKPKEVEVAKTPREGVGKNKYGETVDEKGTPVYAPASSEPVVEDTVLNDLLDITTNWAKGDMDDAIYRKSLNKGVANLARYNQAHLEGIEQRVASDPNLKGTGLGYALLNMAAREAGFKTSDMIGELTIDSMERMQNLQEYGINTASVLEDRTHRRKVDAYNDLLTNGNFEGAASVMTNLLEEAYPGLGLKVDASELASRDPHLMDQFTAQMETAAMLAKNGQADAAIGALSALMMDPRFEGWFTEGITADQIVEGMLTGEAIGNLDTIKDIESEINTVVHSDGGTFNDALPHYKSLTAIQGRDRFVNTAKALDLDAINELRAEENLSPYIEKDGEIGFMDAEGDFVSLEDEDWLELGWLKDFKSRQEEESSANMFNTVMESFMNSHFAKQFMDEKGEIPAEIMEGFEMLVDEMVLGNMQYDPDTNSLVPTDTTINLATAMKSPDYYHIFYDWPLANFDAKGNIKGEFYGGGQPRPLPDDDILKTDSNVAAQDARDKDLDKKWLQYKSQGGDLQPQEWYFATAGGTKPVDEEKVPEAFRGQMNVFGEQPAAALGPTEGMAAAGGVQTGVVKEPLPENLQAKADAYNSIRTNEAGLYFGGMTVDDFINDLKVTERDIGGFGPDKTRHTISGDHFAWTKTKVQQIIKDLGYDPVTEAELDAHFSTEKKPKGVLPDVQGMEDLYYADQVGFIGNYLGKLYNAGYSAEQAIEMGRKVLGEELIDKFISAFTWLDTKVEKGVEKAKEKARIEAERG